MIRNTIWQRPVALQRSGLMFHFAVSKNVHPSLCCTYITLHVSWSTTKKATSAATMEKKKHLGLLHTETKTNEQTNKSQTAEIE
jgi:hypothetical protein